MTQSSAAIVATDVSLFAMAACANRTCAVEAEMFHHHTLSDDDLEIIRARFSSPIPRVAASSTYKLSNL